MRSNIILAAALARMAAAAPAPQMFDFNAVLDAPSPTATAAPIGAVTATSTTLSVNTASIAASISAAISTEATASVTGESASAASTQEPTTTVLDKRGNAWGKSTSTSSSSTRKTTSSSHASTSSSTQKATTSSKVSTSSSTKETTSSSQAYTSSSSSAQPITSSMTSTTLQQSSTSTTSSSTACPTTPEAGTYCGFINPEDPCAVQPTAYGPTVSPDTVAAFEAYPEFQQDALNAQTPEGYVEVFKNLNASTSANSYITYKVLESYNVSACASFCDDTDLCTGFNIYIERDPSLNPTDGNTSATYCPNPASVTNYKCSVWGSSIDASSATNYGDYQEQFQVVIAGSNGYDKTNTTTPPAQPGYSAPTNCSGGAITSSGSYWMGTGFYPGPYNPALCATYASAQTSKNKQIAQQNGASSYTPCNMFNSFMVHKNGVAQGTYCQLYDTSLSPSWASFLGGWSGEDFMSVESSWTYTLSELLDGTF